MAIRLLEVEGIAKRLQVIANDMGGRTPGWSPIFALERAQQQLEELVREVKRDWESAT